MDSRAEICSSGSRKNEWAKNLRTVRPRFIEDAERDDINKQAEDFIKSFRNQLKIQREESLKRFKETIHGGT
ncbi:hypothetical protein LguiA_013076 [Lonicera macranthoides]